MAHLFFRLKHFLSYQLLAHHDQGHGVHSPFIYQFIVHLLEDERYFYAFDAIDDLRHSLSNNATTISITDLGAGQNNGKQLSVRSIYKRAAIPVKYGELLFKLTDHFQPRNIIELGTSLGVSTAYLASANSKAKVTTFEGCTETAHQARQSANFMQLKNIFFRTGHFHQQLPIALSKIPTVDFAFIDGNHTYEATMHYFELLLPKAEQHSIFVFDDIYWSPDMLRAWREIQNHPKVILTIDLFSLGLVFFRKGMAKQNLRIRY